MASLFGDTESQMPDEGWTAFEMRHYDDDDRNDTSDDRLGNEASDDEYTIPFVSPEPVAFAARSSEDAEEIPVPGMEGEFEYIGVPKAKAKPKSANVQWHRTGRPLTPAQAADRKMSYGEHKGKMFTEIMKLDPNYPEKLTTRFPDPAKHPVYVSEFLAWSTIWRAANNVAVPSDGRTKRGSLPAKQPNACTGGCTRFTKLGSNQHEPYRMTRVRAWRRAKESREPDASNRRLPT
jgi:hypothetical protein